MLRFIPAVAAALIAGPALADQMTMSHANQAASLRDGPLDMVAYYEPAPGGGLEVSATFTARSVMTASSEPARLLIMLGEGDDVAFTMPGYPEARYRFVRSGEAVTASVWPTAPDEPQLADF